ncbi:hypothetical protein EW146_g8812 [Bondarzewia mesenterica]|uniref:Enoyl reductase (ER) domain-containing protein n=1 Tax=Bondarzewia mesenterica TaxID=1095465 RepID=A0A4V3XDA9_9AGAM|nr:hypothetical protein EW146_g8812 [Bondarzewia mesenterica]
MSFEIPLTQQALILQADRTLAVVAVPVPKPGPGQILVQVTVGAQNPTDWKALKDGRVNPGYGLGHDFAGRVVLLGEGVTNVAVGERVAGFVLPSRSNTMGAFREYTVVGAHPLLKIPDVVHDEEAATLPVASTTAALGLRHIADFPRSAPLDHTILVWGGSSSVGLYAIQLARTINLRVIATASPHNHALVRAHGADVVIDYHAPDVVEQVVRATGRRGGVDYVFDAISEDESVEPASRCLKRDGPRKAAVVLVPHEKQRDPSVEYHLVIAPSLLGGQTNLGSIFIPNDERNLRFANEFYALAADWLREGRLKANPYTVRPGGLTAIQEGLKLMQDGKVMYLRDILKPRARIDPSPQFIHPCRGIQKIWGTGLLDPTDRPIDRLTSSIIIIIIIIIIISRRICHSTAFDVHSSSIIASVTVSVEFGNQISIKGLALSRVNTIIGVVFIR